MHLVKDHILRQVGGNAVLVPTFGSTAGFNAMISLNHTGEFICRMLREDTDAESIAAALTREYDVDAERAKEDVEAFLSELRSCNMLEE